MHIEFAWKVQFLTVYAILQYLGSIWAVFHSIVKSYWKENMVCINSPSKLPMCIKFWWKKMNSQWIWLIFAIFDFLSDFVGLLWPFFWGAQCIPNSKIWFMPSKTILDRNISPKTTNLYDYFCLIGFVTLKNRFLTFVGGPKCPPRRPSELKTSRYGA